MSGVISDNLGRTSGLVKASTAGAPASGSSDPATDRNPTAVGARFVNTTSGELFVATQVTADDNVWVGQLGTSIELAKWTGSRGVWTGGRSSAMEDEMDYVTIASLGNASDFGNLQAAKGYGGAVSNGSRGVFFGGEI